MELVLYFSIFILPTVAIFTLLKSIKIIVEKDASANWYKYAFISGICLTISFLAVAMFD